MSDDTTATEFNDIIGLGIADALAKVKSRGINTIRAKMKDGKMQMVTMDIRTDRLDVATTGGQITSIMGIG